MGVNEILALTFDIRFARKGKITEFEVTQGPKEAVARRAMTEWAKALRNDSDVSQRPKTGVNEFA